MEAREHRSILRWLYNRSERSKIKKSDFAFWKFNIFRTIFQCFLFTLGVILPWYKLYRPASASVSEKVILAGASNVGGVAIGLLAISAILSITETVIITATYNNYKLVNLIRSIEIVNIAPSLLILSVMTDPIFLPGLGDLYTDYIGLFVLNWAGFQIIPMLGYLCVVVAFFFVLFGVISHIFFAP